MSKSKDKLLTWSPCDHNEQNHQLDVDYEGFSHGGHTRCDVAQAGDGEAKQLTTQVVCGKQCILRTGTVEITPNMILDEVTHLDRQAQSSDTFSQVATVVLIYLAVGPCIHSDVKKVRGQVLLPGCSI